jgi:putative transposase
MTASQCEMHFARNLLAWRPRRTSTWSPRVFRTIFAQPDPTAVAPTWNEVRDQLAGRFPKIGTLMDEARPEVLALTAFPDRTGPRSGAPTPW